MAPRACRRQLEDERNPGRAGSGPADRGGAYRLRRADLPARHADPGNGARAQGRVKVGGQDCHAKASGAHTGDIAAARSFRDAGASHVIPIFLNAATDHHETDAEVLGCRRLPMTRALSPSSASARPRRSAMPA